MKIIYENSEIKKLVNDFIKQSKENNDFIDFSIQTEDRLLITVVWSLEPEEVKTGEEEDANIRVRGFNIPIGWYRTGGNWTGVMEDNRLEIRHPFFKNTVYVLETSDV